MLSDCSHNHYGQWIILGYKVCMQSTCLLFPPLLWHPMVLSFLFPFFPSPICTLKSTPMTTFPPGIPQISYLSLSKMYPSPALILPERQNHWQPSSSPHFHLQTHHPTWASLHLQDIFSKQFHLEYLSSVPLSLHTIKIALKRFHPDVSLLRTQRMSSFLLSIVCFVYLSKFQHLKFLL